MRRTLLAVVALVLVVIGGVSAALYFYNRQPPLRVAVPHVAEDTRLMAAMTHELTRHRERVQFKIVSVADSAAGAKALAEGQADLAVMRSDIAVPASVQAIAVLHRNTLMLVAPGGSKLRAASDLRGKRVGVVHEIASADPNNRLLETILVQYGVAVRGVTLVPLGVEEIRDAVVSKKIDAIFAVVLPQGALARDIVSAMTEANARPPVFLSIPASKAIAKRAPALEAMDIVQGAFGADPLRPAADVESLGVSVLLAADENLKEQLASEATRLLLHYRGAAAAVAPSAALIEPPPTDKNAPVPAHKGAADFLEGNEKDFFEKYGDMIYIAGMGFSVLGSGAAAVASRYASRRHAPTERLTDRMLQILAAARSGASGEELERFEREIDEALMKALADRGLSGDPPGLQVAALALEQARRAVNARRKALAKEGKVLPFPREVAGD